MRTFMRNLSLVYAAGSLGALANSLVAWLFGLLGITAMAGVKIAPALTHPWLYQRLVWGGIWGLLFLLPVWVKSPFLRGVLLSVGPTLIQLFVVFPFQAGKGMLGLQLGSATPIFVIIFNAVWGVAAAYWLELIDDTRLRD